MQGITLQGAISRADLLKPNAYEAELKTDWINKLESMIQTEIIMSEEVKEYNWESDINSELTVKQPYSDIYEAYIMAMIDYHNNDIQSYQNSMAVFNAVYDEFAKAYKRDNPTSLGSIKNYW